LEKRNIEIVFEEYYPMDQTDFSASAAKIHSEKIDCLVNAVIGGLLPFSKQVFETGFYKNGGLVFHPAFSDSSFDYVPSKFFPNTGQLGQSNLILQQILNEAPCYHTLT